MTDNSRAEVPMSASSVQKMTDPYKVELGVRERAEVALLIKHALDPMGEDVVAYRPAGAAIAAISVLRKAGWRIVHSPGGLGTGPAEPGFKEVK